MEIPSMDCVQMWFGQRRRKGVHSDARGGTKARPPCTMPGQCYVQQLKGSRLLHRTFLAFAFASLLCITNIRTRLRATSSLSSSPLYTSAKEPPPIQSLSLRTIPSTYIDDGNTSEAWAKRTLTRRRLRLNFLLPAMRPWSVFSKESCFLGEDRTSRNWRTRTISKGIQNGVCLD